MLIGDPVSLDEMLLCRERSAACQEQLLSEYNCPVISFCLNIPGPIKTNADLYKVFEFGKQEIITMINSLELPILKSIQFSEKTGDELIMSIDGKAEIIKDHTCLIEDHHTLGRLFDIDVIDVNGNKLSREAYRKCLICNCQAQECASSRRHSIAEMQAVITKSVNDYLKKTND